MIFSIILAAALAMPGPELLQRVQDGPDVFGIIHWGTATYTDQEWGFGDADPAILAPDAFDADQIVGACKAGGLGGVVLVCKHHDGFCLWPTKTTPYNISASPFRGGKGDVVREIEQACRRAGLKFGVYVSPWDRNSAAYGTAEYVEIYHEQYRELCGGEYGEIFEAWFDGANGGDGWYGGANERRSIPDGYYKVDELLEWLRAAQPGITFMGTNAKERDFNWPGNERGEIPLDSAYSEDKRFAHDGRFRMYECDFPQRTGWFYHKRDDGATKDGLALAKIYFLSVGRGGTMNIGISPDKSGRVTEEDAAKLKDFKKIIDELFAHEVVDDGEFNIVELREDISRGERVRDWKISVGGVTVAEGRFIGAKRLVALQAAVRGEISIAAAPDASIRIRRFLAPQKLLADTISASPAEETETAKRMLRKPQDGKQ